MAVVTYLDGWKDDEREGDEYFPSRSMGAEASLLVPWRLHEGRRFAALPLRCDTANASYALTVSAGHGVLAELRLLQGWHIYEFALPPSTSETSSGPLSLTFRLNRTSDSGPLAVRIGEIELHDDARRHESVRRFHDEAWKRAGAAEDPGSLVGRVPESTEPYLPPGGEGWYQWEFQDPIPFRWMTLESRVSVPAEVHRGRRFCTFRIYSDYDDLSQVVSISAAGEVMELPLVRYWSYCSLAFDRPPTGDLKIAFRVNKVMPATARHPDERRQLAVRVSPLLFHDDEARHRDARIVYENAVLNTREFLAGATVLRSYPLTLGIDLYGKCNVKPPCVYCWWEDAKGLEAENVGAGVDERTLESYGMFFRAASSLVNCSFGEPLLHPRLDQILHLAADRGKLVELSTNGQAFTPETVAALAGRPVVLYVSLDAASADVYARLRNDRWQDVITGLTFLRDARRRAKHLPKVNMVFMPMRANLQDLEAYFRLCRMVEADLLVLRPLTRGNKTIAIADRGGYHFDYHKEMLTLDEMSAVADRCQQYSSKYRVLVANQLDFGVDGQVGAAGEMAES